MAVHNLGQVAVGRAVGKFELEVGQTTSFEAPVNFPLRPSLEFPELSLVVVGENQFATAHEEVVRSQNQITGYLTFDLVNDTAGAPGDMGEFRVEVQRKKG